jgi:hypothetical protein
MRLFELHDLNAQFERISIRSGDEQDIVNICETDFKINFIDDNTDSFINTLYNKCVESELTLRKPAATDDLLENEFKTLLENNHFDEALKKLKDLETKYNLEDMVTQLTGNWNSIKENQKDGVIDAQELMLDMNKFRKQLQLAIADDLEQAKQN